MLKYIVQQISKEMDINDLVLNRSAFPDTKTIKEVRSRLREDAHDVLKQIPSKEFPKLLFSILSQLPQEDICGLFNL